MKRQCVAVACLAVLMLLAGCGEKAKMPAYRVAATRDVSYRGCVRILRDVTLSEARSYSSAELICIAKSETRVVTGEKRINALGVFFWFAGDPIGQQAARASVDWAPFGDWGRADEVSTGSYSSHHYAVDFNNT
jgi:hypothetical protein